MIWTLVAALCGIALLIFISEVIRREEIRRGEMIEWSDVPEVFWRLLPDKCEAADCARQGVRGNENIIPVGNEVAPPIALTLCDYCDAKYRGRYHEVRAIRVWGRDRRVGR